MPARVAVGLISRTNNSGAREYLLVSSEREKFGEWPGAYYPPGGHVEPGESDERALIREVTEELGLTVRPTALLDETPGDVADQITTWWLCELEGGTLTIDRSELADADWFTLDAIHTLRYTCVF